MCVCVCENIRAMKPPQLRKMQEDKMGQYVLQPQKMSWHNMGNLPFVSILPTSHEKVYRTYSNDRLEPPTFESILHQFKINCVLLEVFISTSWLREYYQMHRFTLLSAVQPTDKVCSSWNIQRQWTKTGHRQTKFLLFHNHLTAFLETL